MDSSLPIAPIETGKIKSYNRVRGFGFIELDGGGKLFFHISELIKAGMDTIDNRMPVSVRRGIANDKREKVTEFVLIDGKPPVPRGFYFVNRRLVLRACEPEPPAKKPITQDEWITVIIKKIRPEHTSYAHSDLLGNIKVPWSVFQKAKIKSSKEDKYEVRCKESGDMLVAHEIRRY